MTGREARIIARSHTVTHREPAARCDWLTGVTIGLCVAGITLGLAFAIITDGWHSGQTREQAECLGALVGATTPPGPWGK